MQNNPDVNSLNIGKEPESHPESINTGKDSGRTNVEGVKKPIETNKSTGKAASSEQTEKKK